MKGNLSSGYSSATPLKSLPSKSSLKRQREINYVDIQTEAISIDSRKEDTSDDSHNKDIASLAKGDVIGCCIDMEKETVRYTKNGKSVKGHLKLFKDCCELLTPAVSFSTATR